MDERLSHALCNRQPSNRITGCYRKPEADKDDLAIYVVECLERIGTMLSKNIQNAIERQHGTHMDVPTEQGTTIHP